MSAAGRPRLLQPRRIVAGSLEEAETNVEEAAAAQQIAAEAQPSVGTLTTLAIYEYYADNFAAGDKAAAQASAKVPKAEAKEVKKQMAEFRARGKAFENAEGRIRQTRKETAQRIPGKPLRRPRRLEQQPRAVAAGAQNGIGRGPALGFWM